MISLVYGNGNIDQLLARAFSPQGFLRLCTLGAAQGWYEAAPLALLRMQNGPGGVKAIVRDANAGKICEKMAIYLRRFKYSCGRWLLNSIRREQLLAVWARCSPGAANMVEAFLDFSGARGATHPPPLSLNTVFVETP